MRSRLFVVIVLCFCNFLGGSLSARSSARTRMRGSDSLRQNNRNEKLYLDRRGLGTWKNALEDACRMAQLLAKEGITNKTRASNKAADIFARLDLARPLLGNPLRKLIDRASTGGSTFFKLRSKQSLDVMSKLICANHQKASTKGSDIKSFNRVGSESAVRFAEVEGGANDNVDEEHTIYNQNSDSSQLNLPANLVKSSAAPPAVLTSDGPDLVCSVSADGTSCSKMGAWCCRGKCEKRIAFQANCGDICPIGSYAGADCTRDTDSVGARVDSSKAVSFCCSSKGGAKNIAPKCISGINFADQCPDTKLDSLAGSAFFGSSVNHPPPMPSETGDGDNMCLNMSPTETKFCSSQEQRERHPGNTFENERYCCLNKCVQFSTYALMCCNNDSPRAVLECNNKAKTARLEAGFRRLPQYDENSQPEQLTPSGSESSQNDASEFSQSVRFSSKSKSSLEFLPPKAELDPFKFGGLKPRVAGNGNEATLRYGPGAMSEPEGWSGGHRTTKADQTSSHKSASTIPILPPAFRKDKEKKCCNQNSAKPLPIPSRPLQLNPRSYQEYDPYPSRNPVCPVTTVTVKREDADFEGVSPKDVAQHIARFTGLWDLHKDAKIAQGQLYAPSRLPFAEIGGHFFIDLDGRSNFAGMSTPGGDAGEFVLALCALEKAREEAVGTKRVELLTLVDVRSLFRAWLHKTAEKRKYFYMQTDHVSLSRLAKTIGMEPDFLSSNSTADLDTKTRQLIIDLATLPEHVGSSHLRLMLSDNAQYECRKEIPEYVITAFWELLLRDSEDPDDSPSLSNSLLYHVNRGYHIESAVVNVYSMEHECPDYIPLLVQGVTPETDSGDTLVTQVFMNHPSAVSALREELAAFLMLNANEKDEVHGGQLIRHMNALGSIGLERTLQVIAPGKARFAVFLTKDPI